MTIRVPPAHSSRNVFLWVVLFYLGGFFFSFLFFFFLFTSAGARGSLLFDCPSFSLNYMYLQWLFLSNVAGCDQLCAFSERGVCFDLFEAFLFCLRFYVDSCLETLLFLDQKLLFSTMARVGFDFGAYACWFYLMYLLWWIVTWIAIHADMITYVYMSLDQAWHQHDCKPLSPPNGIHEKDELV